MSKAKPSKRNRLIRTVKRLFFDGLGLAEGAEKCTKCLSCDEMDTLSFRERQRKGDRRAFSDFLSEAIGVIGASKSELDELQGDDPKLMARIARVRANKAAMGVLRGPNS